ncbi:MAG TPA: hypothetical protein VKC53_02440 [Patescibacteria group bacterium]|nr:hypothetical protein [Patescibacteria group bacterium]
MKETAQPTNQAIVLIETELKIMPQPLIKVGEQEYSISTTGSKIVARQYRLAQKLSAENIISITERIVPSI